MLTPPNVTPLHYSSDHATPYVLIAKDVTWKKAREECNVDDVMGIGIVMKDPMKESMSDEEHSEVIGFIRLLDNLAGVKMPKADHLVRRYCR